MAAMYILHCLRQGPLPDSPCHVLYFLRPLPLVHHCLASLLPALQMRLCMS